MMAAFSTNTNILSPPRQRQLPILPLRRSNILKPYSNLQFPIDSKQLNCSTAAARPHISSPDIKSITTGNFINQGWPEFVKNVSGEWDGFGADFTVDGDPIELPESVVPEAYREWEVKVFDWQTQCPTLAQLNNNCPSLVYKTIKLLPTVGCEADAATSYSIQERSIAEHHTNSVLGYHSTGCYVAVWPDGANKSMELEHCLIDPNNKELRVRIIQVVELQETELNLRGIKVFSEQWYGPFRNGDQLGGCAIRDSAFAATQALEASQVSGVWRGLGSVATFNTSHNKKIQELRDECVHQLIREEGGLILLPKQLWCSVKRAKDKATCCEAGWLLAQGRGITSKCTFSSTGELKEIALSHENATPV